MFCFYFNLVLNAFAVELYKKIRGGRRRILLAQLVKSIFSSSY